VRVAPRTSRMGHKAGWVTKVEVGPVDRGIRAASFIDLHRKCGRTLIPCRFTFSGAWDAIGAPSGITRRRVSRTVRPPYRTKTGFWAGAGTPGRGEPRPYRSGVCRMAGWVYRSGDAGPAVVVGELILLVALSLRVA